MALSSTETLRPSGTRMTISSARTVSPVLSASARGNSRSEISRPSARRMVSTSRSCSAVWPGFLRPSTSLLPSLFRDTGTPVPALNTTTPTGVVSISVSR